MKKGTTTDREVAYGILDEAEIIWLAMNDETGPYCLPVNHARKGDTLYIHSGIKGRKAEALRDGRPVAFSAAVDLDFKSSDNNACAMGYRFRSACGTAVPEELSGNALQEALDILTLKYAGKAMPYDEKALRVTTAFALTIGELTARVKG